MDSRFALTFRTAKPILGMLHLTGTSAEERLDIAKKETETLVAGGIDGLIVENYFGDTDDVRRVLAWLETRRPAVSIGVNVLRDHRLSFALAAEFPIDFIQMDSVAGHLPPDEDQDFAAELRGLRAGVGALLLGGVRFKYQPVRSGRSEDDDLRIGMQRCDGFVVTSDATGQETDLGKVARFRAVVGDDFPLLIGAGMTATNARDQLAGTNGAVVGSFFKDSYKDKGIVFGAHVEELMQVVRAVRAGVGATLQEG